MAQWKMETCEKLNDSLIKNFSWLSKDILQGGENISYNKNVDIANFHWSCITKKPSLIEPCLLAHKKGQQNWKTCAVVLLHVCMSVF